MDRWGKFSGRCLSFSGSGPELTYSVCLAASAIHLRFPMRQATRWVGQEQILSGERRGQKTDIARAFGAQTLNFVQLQLQPKHLAPICTISRPISSEAVAAGEGTLSTCSIRSEGTI